MGFLSEKLKKMKREQWLLLLLVGILLMAAVIPDGKQKTENQQQTQNSAVQSEDTQIQNISQMEKRLENILCRMKGAGEVQVMITQEESGEKIVEKDIPVSSQEVYEKGEEAADKTSSQESREETTVYIKDASGVQIPYVNKETAPRIRGVLVLAQGGDNPVVAADITDAIMALFNIEAHKIKVMKMN